jgi:hypothetical protein
MNYETLLAWISEGGYGFLPDWPSNECIAYSEGTLYLYVGINSVTPFTPTTEESGATTWGHSPEHTDKPPRMS